MTEMRASGVRDILIYCRDHRCSHHVETGADDVRLSDIKDSSTCSPTDTLPILSEAALSTLAPTTALLET